MARFGISDGTQPPVVIDAKTESLASGIHRAALQTIGQGGPTPLEAMHKEHGRLLKAFREAEGRDPDPNFDPQFWTAYAKILKARTGEDFHAESAAEYSAVQKRSRGDGYMDPEDDLDLEWRMAKAVADGTAPAWARGILARNR